MLVPAIDLMGGRAVTLVGGNQQAAPDRDPRELFERYRLAGSVTLIDVDAALGQGSNEPLIRELLRLGSCRIGGGVRTVEAARAWLDAGAAKVILGTAARPEILEELPQERVIAAIDVLGDELLIDGRSKPTGLRAEDRIRALAKLVGGFLVTFVDREGSPANVDFDRIEPLIRAAGDARVTFAGGITTPEDIAMLDRMGADAQVVLALATGTLDLADAIAAPLRSDRPDGLWPTIVCDEHGIALGLAYSNGESLREAIRRGRGVYWSRKRGLWIKGEGSGSVQTLLGVALDCDRDTLRFSVLQSEPGFCHEGTRTCWGDDQGLPKLARTLAARRVSPPAGSYTRRLFEDPALLSSKLREEVDELIEAVDPDDVAWETADVIYFALVAAARAGVPLSEVQAQIERRALRVTRRKGDAKPPKETT